jgi:Uma2 family endonuclease
MSLAGPTPQFTATDPSFPPGPEVLERAHRISVEKYHELAKSGIIAERTELIRGVVVDKMSESPLHSWLIDLLGDWLRAGVGGDWRVREGHPLTAQDSEPEPDLLVAKGSRDTFRLAHPASGALAIEVAISSTRLDRVKADIYAEASIDEYWIVYAERGYVEVHRKPVEGRYDVVTTLRPGDTLSPLAFPHLTLAVSELFPAAA